MRMMIPKKRESSGTAALYIVGPVSCRTHVRLSTIIDTVISGLSTEHARLQLLCKVQNNFHVRQIHAWVPSTGVAVI